jgi:spore germination cell wall hydrolase CwlJ-like protein
MLSRKKLLITLFVSAVFSLGLGTTASAAELDFLGTQQVQISTKDKQKEDTTINILSTNARSMLPLQGRTGDYNQSTEAALIDGYYIDEQGEVCYAPSDKGSTETVILEIDEDIKESKKEKKEAKKGDKPSYTAEDLRLLTGLIYSEAGNQSYEGMLAVANVVLNRVKSKSYSHVDTVKEVIYDRKWAVQFAVTVKNKKTGMSMLDSALKYYDSQKYTSTAQKKAMERAKKAAKAALNGENNIGKYLCFQNKRGAASIKRKYSNYRIIGDHIFYRTK